MKVFNTPIIEAERMNTTLTSAAIPLVNTYGYAVQAVVTGTPTGSIKLQVSADPYNYANATQPQAPTNWLDLDNASINLTTSGITLWNVSSAFYNFVRLVYTDSSSGASTAILNASINAKGFGN